MKGSRAETSLIRLKPRESEKLLPISDYGFVLVTLHDCSLLINGQRLVLHRGDFQEVKGSGILELSNTSSAVASLVLVKIQNASQNLTVQTTTLSHNQELEDASDRNTTLLIAVIHLRLRDVRDLGDEGQPWKPGKPTVIELQEGQIGWLNPGIHRLRNLGDTKTQFVTIEW